MKLIRYILLAAFAPAFVACNTTGCLDNQSAVPLAGFYDSEGGAISLTGIEISGVGVPGDSVLVEPGSSVAKVYLPMRSTRESTAWCIHYTQEGLDNPALNDTISFGYTSEPYFASLECGAMYYYHIKEMRYTTHLIDSVAITDSLITNVDIERIHIYFRTSNSDTDEE